MSIYEIGLIGNVSTADRSIVSETVSALIADFDLKVGSGVMIRGGEDFTERDTHAATAVAYFGGATPGDLELLGQAHEASLPIVPVLPVDGEVSAHIPSPIQGLNALRRRSDDPRMREVAVRLLECLGLLRSQRRVFVSYRRIEARSAAVQLHDLLGERGFDVFLDTHDIRPGEVFQEVLWHRLCDSDVMVMLDTPTYFASKWTRQELGRARAKGIHVLRVVWPDHTPTMNTDFAETIYLDRTELSGGDGPIIPPVADQIALAVESLRSRSIASRYMSITGKLRAEVERIGGALAGIGAHRAILVRLPDNATLWAYPVVGIPTADLLNDIVDKARGAGQHEVPILVYDHVGIRDQWMAHLKWLDENISVVRAVRVAEAAWVLAAWGGRA